MCLPFTLSGSLQKGWQYSVIIFVGINMAAFLIILVGYISIQHSVTSSHRAAGNMSNDDVILARKVAFIILTDFACWGPIIIMTIASLCQVKVPPTLSAWVAIIILPINSALNPILYTLVNVDCKSKKKN